MGDGIRDNRLGVAFGFRDGCANIYPDGRRSPGNGGSRDRGDPWSDGAVGLISYLQGKRKGKG